MQLIRYSRRSQHEHRFIEELMKSAMPFDSILKAIRAKWPQVSVVANRKAAAASAASSSAAAVRDRNNHSLDDATAASVEEAAPAGAAQSDEPSERYVVYSTCVRNMSCLCASHLSFCAHLLIVKSRARSAHNIFCAHPPRF